MIQDEIDDSPDPTKDEPCQEGYCKREPEGSKLLFNLMDRMPYPVKKPQQTMFDLSRYENK